MTIEVNSPRLHEVVDPDAEVEQVATGFEFTEGPVWNGLEGFLLFSDVSGDVTVRWSEGDGATRLAPAERPRERPRLRRASTASSRASTTAASSRARSSTDR